MTRTTRREDPVIGDQGGRLMPSDPYEPIHNITEDKIRLRAYHLYEQRGRTDGYAERDWFEAQAELLSK